MKQADPKSILLLKSHSAGIGDLLRSSAAWRALRDALPKADLHLLFLTRDPGYPSEVLIAHHPLLKTFQVLDKRTSNLRSLFVFFKRVNQVLLNRRPEWVIDFEPNGLRTSLIALWARARYGIRTFGINQQPLRGLFYQTTAPSSRAYARQKRLPWPLEYTERDFVVLAALALCRESRPIELAETPEGERFRKRLPSLCGLRTGDRIVGVNIGCGTPDALNKRPSLALISALVGELQRNHGVKVVLSGAAFETDANAAFRQLHAAAGRPDVVDLGGQTSLLEMTGLLRACSLYVSSDSGPYHMAVALGTPTLAIFNWANPTHYHVCGWVKCLVAPEEGCLPAALGAAEELLAVGCPARDR
jgi:ADP-heptose:LPS heptosyltransferase